MSASDLKTPGSVKTRARAGARKSAMVAQPTNIRELFLYRLGTLNNVMARTMALQNRRRFGLSTLDWRLIGLVAAMEPTSLNRLARAASLEKSQASRAVSKLIASGFIKRGADEADARGVQLVLTAKGRSLYDRVLPTAIQRNAALLDVLAATERAVLDVILDKLTTRAFELLAEESALRNDKNRTRQRS